MNGICKYCNQEIKKPIDKRSIEQLNLLFACLEILKDHKSHDVEWNTKEKCLAQVKWAIKYIDRESAIHLTDSKGNSKLYFELDSISFKTPHKKANQFINDALNFMAGELGVTVDELITAAKER